jgi:hypothetical protein
VALFLHIILFLPLLLYLTNDLFLLETFFFLETLSFSIQFGQIILVVFYTALGTIIIGNGICMLPCVSSGICSKSLLILAGPR